MSVDDVFVSHAHADKRRARAVVRKLEGQGYQVFWGDKLLSGQRWRTELLSRAQTARCIVVLWSRASVQRDTVIDEAEVGRDRDVLVPVWLEEAELPYPFGKLQTIDMTDEDNAEVESAWVRLVESID